MSNGDAMKTDRYGNIACKCGAMHSPRYQSCQRCCKHQQLTIEDAWLGADHGGAYGFVVECQICGKDTFDETQIEVRVKP